VLDGLDRRRSLPHQMPEQPSHLWDGEGQQWICFGLVESGFVAIRPAFRTEPD
jgi:hypothetical protein